MNYLKYRGLLLFDRYWMHEISGDKRFSYEEFKHSNPKVCGYINHSRGWESDLASHENPISQDLKYLQQHKDDMECIIKELEYLDIPAKFTTNPMISKHFVVVEGPTPGPLSHTLNEKHSTNSNEIVVRDDEQQLKQIRLMFNVISRFMNLNYIKYSIFSNGENISIEEKIKLVYYIYIYFAFKDRKFVDDYGEYLDEIYLQVLDAGVFNNTRFESFESDGFVLREIKGSLQSDYGLYYGTARLKDKETFLTEIIQNYLLDLSFGYDPDRYGFYSKANKIKNFIDYYVNRECNKVLPSYATHVEDLLGVSFAWSSYKREYYITIKDHTKFIREIFGVFFKDTLYNVDIDSLLEWCSKYEEKINKILEDSLCNYSLRDINEDLKNHSIKETHQTKGEEKIKLNFCGEEELQKLKRSLSLSESEIDIIIKRRKETPFKNAVELILFLKKKPQEVKDYEKYLDFSLKEKIIDGDKSKFIIKCMEDFNPTLEI